MIIKWVKLVWHIIPFLIEQLLLQPVIPINEYVNLPLVIPAY